MNLPLTIGNIPPGVIILLVIVFVIGRWVYNTIQEFKARTRALQTGLENPNQDVAVPTSDEGRASRSGGGAETPGNLSASEHAEREKARQQYAERAERLRAQRLGKGMPDGAVSGQMQPNTGAGRSEEGWTSTPSPAKSPQAQSQVPMAQSRQLPAQQPKALPTNKPAQQKPPQAQPQLVRKPTARAQATQSLQMPEAIIPGAPAGVGIGEETQSQQRARGGQPRPQAPQAAKVTSQAPVQHALARIGTIEELRRAVVLKEILDQPVSLRE